MIVKSFILNETKIISTTGLNQSGEAKLRRGGSKMVKSV